MRMFFLVLSFVLLTNHLCSGQHLIGVDKNFMPGLVKKEMKEFNLDNSIRNPNFNYLKFLNSAGTRTLFIFFDDKDISTSTRLVCDYSELDIITDDLHKKYRKTGENNWEYSLNQEKFIVSLEKKEWYFVVSVKKQVYKKAKNKKFFWWKRQN